MGRRPGSWPPLLKLRSESEAARSEQEDDDVRRAAGGAERRITVLTVGIV